MDVGWVWSSGHGSSLRCVRRFLFGNVFLYRRFVAAIEFSIMLFVETIFAPALRIYDFYDGIFHGRYTRRDLLVVVKIVCL